MGLNWIVGCEYFSQVYRVVTPIFRSEPDPDARQAADDLRRLWSVMGFDEPLHTAVVLGSGLRAAADDALRSGAISVDYSDVTGMPVPQVVGHAGRFVTGGKLLNGCVFLQGRSHFYEGFTLAEVTFPVLLLAELGIRTLILTNAAGGIRHPPQQPGDLMLITDHLSLIDMSPLRHVTELSRTRREHTCWSRRLLDIAHETETVLRVHRGCFAMMSGPSYETPAEVRMLAALGADAVGMSTVPEAIVARRLGIEVVGVSCITNAAVGLSESSLDHQKIDDVAAGLRDEFVDWLLRLLATIRELHQA